RVEELCATESGHVVTLGPVTSVEVASALGRKFREGRFTADERADTWADFAYDLAVKYKVIDWDDEIREEAQRLTFRHPLRAYDAVQLASTLRLAELAGEGAEIIFVTGDRRQQQAATAEGLRAELI